jgi:uncharacterized RDD family membrane protein YckC
MPAAAQETCLPGNYVAHGVDRLSDLEGRPLATFVARATALLVDIVLLNVITILTSFLWAWSMSRALASLRFTAIDAIHTWWAFVALVVYFGALTYLGHGQTPGKRLLRIRVVSLIHERLSLWHSFERALGYAASTLELGFGFLQYFIHPNAQTVHDRIAETIVISDGPILEKAT